jgi:hypothetical protein
MPRRVTIDDIKSRLSSMELQCTDDKYRGPYHTMNFICKDGHEFRRTWDEIKDYIRKKKPLCPICHREYELDKGIRLIEEKELYESIKECNIIEKVFRKDRWYVRISPPFNGWSMMPHANYVWLSGNPAFYDAPKGYVVHHLDGDMLNDDISNLVIMQKHHHAAYHWKQKTIETPTKINFDSIEVKRKQYFPVKEPHIYPHRKAFRLYLIEKIDGERKEIWINTWNGKPITSREMAETIKSQIWKKEES